MYTFQNKFKLNQLVVYTFGLFWLTFILMISALLILPYFDARIYTNLKDNDAILYHKKIVTMVRTNQISRILSNDSIPSFDKFDGYRPFLIDGHNNMFGVLDSEKEYVKRFIDVSDDPSLPKKKTFHDMQIVGPFLLYLDFNNTYLLYFIEKVNTQQEILRYIFDKPWILLIILISITTPLLWWFSRMIVKPIENLQRSANVMALGTFQVNKVLSTKGPLELRQVGKSFNRMAQAINDLISNQQMLLSSISHELRTPLARLQLSVALLRRKIGEIDSVKRIDKEIDQMDKMINEILMLSRQQMNSHVERSILNVNRLWDNVILDATFEAEQRGITFEVNMLIPSCDNLVVNGNLRLLNSAIENVVRNALKYTKDKIVIKIFLEEEEEEEEEEVVIRVEDNGSGLPESEFVKIFNPFYRVDEARTRTTGGTGLGLAIVSSVVHEHQGKVWAEKSELGGLAVNIKLPLWIDV